MAFKQWLIAGIKGRKAWLGSALALILLLFSPAGAEADYHPQGWQYLRPLTGGETEGFVWAPVPMDVHLKSARLDDLRVVDGEGREVPYHLAVEGGRKQEKAVAGQILNQGLTPDSFPTLTIDLGPQVQPHNRVHLEVKGSDFFRRVVVEGSDDNRSWVTLRDKEFILHVTGGEGLRRTLVEYGRSTYRFLRLTVAEGEGTVELLGATVSWLEEALEKEAAWPAELKERGKTEGEKANFILLDLGHDRLSHGLAFAVASSNFHRLLRVEGSDDGSRWEFLGQDEIYAYRLPGYEAKKLSVAYPEGDYRYLRVIFQDGDNLPLEVEGVQALHWPRKVLFAYTPGQSYYLAYGNPGATAPRYDLSRFSGYLQGQDLPVLTVGPEEINPRYVPTDYRPWSERHPWLLWGGLGALVAVLGGLIYRMYKTMDTEGSP